MKYFLLKDILKKMFQNDNYKTLRHKGIWITHCYY